MANPILDADILPLLGILLASGVLAGTLAGLFGVGGGVVLVPALLYAFDFWVMIPIHDPHGRRDFSCDHHSNRHFLRPKPLSERDQSIYSLSGN
ncbi:MAG: hypothetical protein CM15mP88_1950 [Pseudomonadota bacterium]|nr:MAG: hypothetical protein CM15mP88_1950 [Pseudomonadota bacterium]